MKLKSLLCLTLLIIPGLFIANDNGILLSVFTDRHGTWRVPTEGIPTKITHWIIENMPRIDNSFTQVDLSFDMDNDTYFSSSSMYILILGIIGIIYLLFIIAFFIGRYIFDGCGSKNPPKRGYPPSKINCARSFLVFFSFILEGCLVYAYFTNSDLHESITILVDQFQATANVITDQLDTLVSQLPEADTVNPNSSIGVNRYDKELFEKDLLFSARFARKRAANMKETLDNYETYRMLLILFNLCIATVGCAVGVAAGSIHKGMPVVIMLILHGIAGTLVFFSFGIHFAAAKILNEYCNEIPYYIDESNDEFLPMRLQYWYPCASSPTFPFIWEYFTYHTLESMNKFIDEVKTSNPKGFDSEFKDAPPQWYNITSDKIKNSDVVLKGTANVKSYYEIACNWSNIMTIIDQQRTCRWTKSEMRADNFQMCSYARDNLDMIMISQGGAAICIIILTFIAIPAIKQFEYSGNVPGATGVLNGGQKFQGKPAKAKRQIK